MWETAPWTLGRTGEEMLQVLKQRFPCRSWTRPGGAGSSLQPVERNIPEWISTLQTTEWHVKIAIHTAAPGGSHAGEGDSLWRKLQPVEGPCWSIMLEEGASEMNDWKLWADHRSHSPSSLYHVEGEKSGNEGMNFSLGKRVNSRWESAVLILF